MKNALSYAGNRTLVWMRSLNGLLSVILISLLLMLIAFISHNPILRFPDDAQFGIFSLIPVEYWVALALSFILMIANVTNEKRYHFLISMIFFIVVFVDIESFFLHNPVGTTDAFGHYLTGVNLADSSNVFFSTDPLTSYPQLYFGSFIFSKMLAELLGLNLIATVPVLAIFRLIMPIWFFVCMYFLLTKLVPKTKARIITIVMIMAIPHLQFHYSPFAFGLIILPLLIYTIIVPTPDFHKNLLIQAILFTFLMLTHGPLTIYIVPAYAVTVFLHYGLKSTRNSRAHLNVSMPLAVCFIIGMSIFNPLFNHLFFATLDKFGLSATMAYCNVFSGMGYFNPGLQPIGLLGLERLGGNYAVSEFIRMYVLGVFALIAFFGTLSIFKNKKFTGVNMFILGGFFSTGIFLVGSLFYPSLNMTDRAFLYLEFGSVLMLIFLLPDDFIHKLKEFCEIDKSKAFNIFIILILLSPAIGSLAYHYNQQGYFQPPQNEGRSAFTLTHVESAHIYQYWDNSKFTTLKP